MNMCHQILAEDMDLQRKTFELMEYYGPLQIIVPERGQPYLDPDFPHTHLTEEEKYDINSVLTIMRRTIPGTYYLDKRR